MTGPKVQGLTTEQILAARQRALELASTGSTSWGVSSGIASSPEDVVKRAEAYAIFLVRPFIRQEPEPAKVEEAPGIRAAREQNQAGINR